MDNGKLIQEIQELIKDLKYEPYKDFLNQNYEILDNEKEELIILRNIKSFTDKKGYFGDCEDLSYIALQRINNKYPQLKIQLWQGNNQKEFKENCHRFILIKNPLSVNGKTFFSPLQWLRNLQFLELSKSQNIIVDASLQRIEIEKTSKYKKHKLIADTKKYTGIVMYNDKIMHYYEDIILFYDKQTKNLITTFFHGVQKHFVLVYRKEIIESQIELEKLTQDKDFLDFIKNNLNKFKLSKEPENYKLQQTIMKFKK
jgi:hypothetical protein